MGPCVTFAGEAGAKKGKIPQTDTVWLFIETRSPARRLRKTFCEPASAMVADWRVITGGALFMDEVCLPSPSPPHALHKNGS